MRHKEILLAITLIAGFVVAEVPNDVKDYTQTDARYSLESYGGDLAATPTQPSAHQIVDLKS